MSSRPRHRAARRHGPPIGVLDIGTSKIVCLVVAVDLAATTRDDRIVCLGFGHRPSAGMVDGAVADPAALEAAIRATVAQAERTSGIALREVYLTASFGGVSSVAFTAHAATRDGAVRPADTARILADAEAYAERDGRMVLHLGRRGYRVDGVVCGDDPHGLAARQLSADLHAVTAEATAVRNLIAVVARCHLDIAGLVAAPYASARAVTTEAERELGVVVVDLGAGTTGLAVLADRGFLHGEVTPSGQHHLTREIARETQSQVADAERIKTLYGSLVHAPSDMSHTFTYAHAVDADGEIGAATRADLAQIIEPAIAAAWQHIAERRARLAAHRMPIVLAGGGSRLVGLAAYASAALGVPVRMGTTRALAGLPQADGSAAFAGAVGLAVTILEADTRQGTSAVGPASSVQPRRQGGQRYLAAVGRWLTDAL